MTDEERERELREWCNRQLEFPGVAPLVILAALDVGRGEVGTPEYMRLVIAVRSRIVRAMHAAIFGEEAK